MRFIREREGEREREYGSRDPYEDKDNSYAWSTHLTARVIRTQKEREGEIEREKNK